MAAKRLPAKLKLAAGPGETLALAAFIAARGGIAPELALAVVARGGAFLRGRRVRNPDAVLAPGDKVEVVLRERGGEAEGGTEPLALVKEQLLHLDHEVIALDKPAFVSAQEDRGGGTALPDLASALLEELGERTTKALLVHRLDRGTTGVTLLARTRRAQGALLEEFSGHKVKKEYRALVLGAPKEDAGEIALALGPAERGLRRVDPRGEPARTRYQVLERFEGASLLAAFPETGRTHQVRVHFLALGCPLLGDVRYGGPSFLTRPDGARVDFARPLLHALSLELRHPNGGPLKVRAEIPADLASVQNFLARPRSR